MARDAQLDEVRETYDLVATSYVERIPGLSAETLLDIAMLDTFVECVAADGGGSVADVGCGPGRVTAYLRDHGADAFGIDLSSGMIEAARRAYPDLSFAVGSLRELAHADGSLAGILAWYSLIHTPLTALAGVLAGFHRTLRPGGYLLIGFHVGKGVQRITKSYGHEVGVDLQLFEPEILDDLLDRAGFAVLARMVREPVGRERRPQASVLATSRAG